MKRLFLLLCFVCTAAVSARAAEPAADFVAPRFRDGDQVIFTRWVLKNLRFPAIYYESEMEILAPVNYEITKKGAVKSVGVRGDVEKPCADEIVRVVSSSPDWSPLLENGKPADWAGGFTLNFRLCKKTNADGTEELVAEDNTPYPVAEPMPGFDGGGPEEFRAWVLPKIADLKIDTAIRIRVSGVVERDGRMTNLEVDVPRGTDRSLCPAIEERLTDIPAWTPGVLHGEPVRVYLTVEMSTNPGVAFADFIVKGKRGVPDADGAYLIVEQMPTFLGGGIGEFRTWVMRNVKYPASCLQRGVQGRVVVAFVIEPDGRLTIDRVLRSPDPELTAEVQRVVARTPKWKPGRQNGKFVRVRYTLPVDFRNSYPPHSGVYNLPSDRRGPNF